MSVQRTIPRIQCEVQMSRNTLDMLLGFLSGIIAMSVVALVVGITYVEGNGVGIWSFSLAVAALLTLLLLRGVPIDQIKVRDYVTINFTIRPNDEDDRE